MASTNAFATGLLHQWTAADGLPVARIQCLLQTRDGYLWIGTRNALLRFDGQRFLTVGALNCLCLAEDREGTLWIGAEPGLFRCQDGSLEPLAWPKSSDQSGYARTVFSMCPCPDGGIWLDSGGDLFRAHGTQLVQLASHVGVGNNHGLYYSHTGQLFLATDGELRAWSPTDASFAPRTVATPPGRICCITEDAAGGIWFGAFGAVHCLRQSIPPIEPHADAAIPPPQVGRGVLTAPDGGLRTARPTVSPPLSRIAETASAEGQTHVPSARAAGSDSAGRFPLVGVTDYPSALEEKLGWLASIAQDPRGTLWLGTSTGLWLVRGQRVVRPAGLDGAAFGGINCLLVDREGNLFVGTESKGLFCLERQRFTVYTTKDGLAHNDVWSVSAAPDGGVWIGTARGVSHLTHGRWETYGARQGLASEQARTVFADSSGTLWVGTEGTGALYRLQQGRFTQVGPDQGITGHDFFCLYEDAQHHVWVSDGWPHECVAGAFRVVSGASETSGWYIFMDHTGQLWLSGAALDCVREGRWTHYDLQALVGPGLYGVAYEDEHGALWLGSSQHGLVRFKDGRFRAITKAQGLFSDVILSLQEDDAGNYWMNSHTGIFRARKADLNAVADGRQSSVPCVVYGPDDGLLSVEGNGGTLPNSCKAPDGRLWFPTIQGVAVIDPADTQLDALPPPVIIESLRADGKSIFENLPARQPEPIAMESRSTNDPLTRRDGTLSPSEGERDGVRGPSLVPRSPGRGGPSSEFSSPRVARFASELRLPAGHADSLQLRFTATTLLPSARVRFKYRLLGRDKDWHELGTQRFVSLQDLPPGHYTFNVIACNRHGVWNDSGANLAFYVAPFFYQTWLFYVLCALALAAVVAAFQAYRLRVQRRILSLEHAAVLAEQRERIARDLHDDLGASFTQIALLSEVARRQLPSAHAAGTPIAHIADIARHVLDGMSELIWGANPNYDTLANLIAYLREYAARFFASAAIDCRLDFPAAAPDQTLPSDFRRELFLIFKEALSNTQKHSGATRADIRLRIERHGLELVIADNGRGFALEPAAPFKHGLSNMRQRAALLGGSFQLESQPGHGTVIRLQVPLPA